jgi:hypothetical protein
MADQGQRGPSRVRQEGRSERDGAVHPNAAQDEGVVERSASLNRTYAQDACGNSRACVPNRAYGPVGVVGQRNRARTRVHESLRVRLGKYAGQLIVTTMYRRETSRATLREARAKLDSKCSRPTQK